MKMTETGEESSAPMADALFEPESVFLIRDSDVLIKEEVINTDDDFSGSDLEVLTVLRNEKYKRRLEPDDDDDWIPKKAKKRKKDKKIKGLRNRYQKSLVVGCPESIVVTPQFHEVIVKEEPTETRSVDEAILDEARRAVEKRWLECVNGDVTTSWRVDGRYKVQKLPQAEVDIVTQRLVRQQSGGNRKGKNRTFPCKHCDECFSRFADLRKHTLVHQVETRHKCDECGKCFSRGCDLSLHRRTHSAVKQFMCGYCNRAFTQKINMERHVKCVHENSMLRPFHCDMCMQTFVGRSDLRKHLRRHEGPMPFFCFTCGVRFHHDEELQLHLSSEGHGVDVWLCRTCNAVLPKELRKQHNDEHHLSPKPFMCNYCNRSFALKASLTKHLPTHTGVRAFVCRYCSGTFATEQTHRAHVLRHTLLRERHCPHCPKVFYTFTSLGKHLKTHSDERKYKCSMCPAAFKLSDAKKKHETTHEQSRLRFRCSHPGCDVSLTTKSNMERHIASIHLGIRRHKCQYCQRGYSMRCDCLRHEAKCPRNPANEGRVLPWLRREAAPPPSGAPLPQKIYINRPFVITEAGDTEVILGDVGGERPSPVLGLETVKMEVDIANDDVFINENKLNNSILKNALQISDSLRPKFEVDECGLRNGFSDCKFNIAERNQVQIKKENTGEVPLVTFPLITVKNEIELKVEVNME